jgi:hypothetical protein
MLAPNPVELSTRSHHSTGSRFFGPGVARLGRAVQSRYVVYSMYVAVAVLVTIRRGAADSTHTTFKIFRQSFWHLLHGTNLYAPYPLEQGAAAVDLFKYSPSAAALFMPFALPPYWPAMLLWSLLNALALCFALERVLGGEKARLAQWLLLPEAFATMEAMQSNALVTALMIGGFVALEHRRPLRAALAIVGGAALKLYPAAMLVFATFHPRRLRSAWATVAAAVTVFLLPLLVTSPAMLLQQYRWWFATEAYDEQDLLFGGSVMKLVRDLLHVSWPNWPMQVLATAALLAPLCLRRERWSDPLFRVTALASVLVYAVLFNHQAERASFIVGVAGAVIWYVSGAPKNFTRTALTLLCAAGLQSVPLLAVWLFIQRDLWRPARVAVASRARNARPRAQPWGAPEHHIPGCAEPDGHA